MPAFARDRGLDPSSGAAPDVDHALPVVRGALRIGRALHHEDVARPPGGMENVRARPQGIAVEAGFMFLVAEDGAGELRVSAWSTFAHPVVPTLPVVSGQPKDQHRGRGCAVHKREGSGDRAAAPCPEAFSASRTHRRGVSAVHPIFSAIDWIAAHWLAWSEA